MLVKGGPGDTLIMVIYFNMGMVKSNIYSYHSSIISSYTVHMEHLRLAFNVSVSDNQQYFNSGVI